MDCARLLFLVLLSIMLAACNDGVRTSAGANGETSGGAAGGGAAVPSGPPRAVVLSWAPNHEKGVNSPGGGYEVAIGNGPTVDVAYVSGALAPTSVTLSLAPGTHTANVRAYAALDMQGGGSRNFSAPARLTVNVPR